MSPKFARRLLWIAATVPMAYSSQKSAAQVLVGQTSPLDLVRGGLPLILFGIAYLAPRARRPFGAVEFALLAFVTWALASAAWSVSPRTSVLKAVILATGYLCLLLLVRMYNSIDETFSGLATYVHVLACSAFFGYVVFHSSAMKSTPLDPTRRLYGVFPQIDPDLLAVLAAISLALCVLNVGPARLRESLGGRIAISVVDLTVIFEAKTRSALVFAAVVLLLLMLRAGRRSPWPIVALSVIASAAFILVLSKPGLLATLAHRGASSQNLSTLNGRTVIWREALSTWRRHPLSGAGYYSGHRFAVTIAAGQGQNSNLDSTWIETLVDLGAIGAAFLAAFALAAFGRLIKVRRHLEPATFGAAMGITVLYLAQSFVNPTIQSNTYSMVVFGVVALSVSPRGREETAQVGSTNQRRSNGCASIAPQPVVAAR